MMRMIAEIVCPSVVLLGEVVMEPEKVVPYFGTVEKPECHMLYNVTTMATTWNSIATRDIRLLKKQMDIVNSLPKQYTFLNYLRCHDDIGWGLDFATLKDWGMDELTTSVTSTISSQENIREATAAESFITMTR